MTYQELETRHNELLTLTYRMRSYQDKWEQYHVKQDGERFNFYKRKVDAFLKAENQRIKSKQKELF